MPPEEFLNNDGGDAWQSTLDHVMPQNPEGKVLTDEFKDRHLNNLGNLLLMNLGKNASANNSVPTDKVKTLADSTFISHKSVAEVIRTNGQWGEGEIEARKREIIEFALKRWEFR